MARHLLELGHRQLRLRRRTRGQLHRGASAGPGSARRWRRPASPPTRSSAITATSMSTAASPPAKPSCATKRRPTAMFAVSDMMAIGFMRAVYAAGLSVPGDVSVAGLRRHRVRRLLRAAADHGAPAARSDGPRGGRALVPPDPRGCDPGGCLYPPPRGHSAAGRQHCRTPEHPRMTWHPAASRYDA